MGRHTMKFGVLSMNTDEGINPLTLAREAEDLGIESVFLPDHSHIPVHREVRYGGPKDLFADSPGDYPREYYRNRDQLLTLAMMAAVTSRLKIGTGICLVVQRDPIYLAKEVATIDHLAAGRRGISRRCGTTVLTPEPGSPYSASALRP
jgi:alkanesulfonate monooxygenase SsuD/methylene tetrahydromethanopterin reductase-like flavin-dependent oxidoreductase (luciferase family)